MAITKYKGHSISETFAGIGRPPKFAVRKLSACGVVGMEYVGDYDSVEQAKRAVDNRPPYAKEQMEACARLILGGARMGKEPSAADAISLAKMVLGIPGAIPQGEDE